MKWKDEYLKMESLDRIIRWIYDLTVSDFKTYDSLPEYRKKQIKFIKFDEFVTNPFSICKELEEFIGREITWKTKRILKRENCPRRIDLNERIKNEEYIRNNMDDESIDLLEGLIHRYHRWIEGHND